MEKPMTVDELIALIKGQIADRSGMTSTWRLGWNEAMLWCAEHIEANRPALDRRGVLRFVYYPYDGWYLCAACWTQEDHRVVHTGDALTDKQACENFAQSLDLDAEFVEPPHD